VNVASCDCSYRGEIPLENDDSPISCLIVCVLIASDVCVSAHACVCKADLPKSCVTTRAVT